MHTPGHPATQQRTTPFCGIKQNCPVAGQKYFPCSAENLDACPTVGQYMEDFFGFEYEFRWWCVLILLVFIMFFRVAAMVVLKLVNHQKR